jgi:uncharacterized membrane protein YgaE (UPF0421/DUF939 family)
MILSVFGTFKMILMIIGGFIALRFIGQLLMAKRGMEEERKMNEANRKFQSEKAEKLKNFGKTKIINNKETGEKVQDVDYEVVE